MSRWYLTRDSDGRRIKIIIPQLPEELIQQEILTRLPIKSVVRFKSVCKSWLSLFSNPQFVKKHYKQNILQNSNEYDCLVANQSEKIVILSRYQKRFVLPKHHFDNLIGSAEGLVCIHRQTFVFLWNPAIHQYKKIHLPPLGHDCLILAGFAFDRVTNDYKVPICYRDDNSSRCFAVYSSNSDSWIHNDDSDYDDIFSFKYTNSHPTTMVKNCPYWTSSTTVSSGRHDVILSLVALKFDATSNKFKLLPKFSSVFGDKKKFKVVNLRDLLTLMAYDPCTTGKLDIYSLHEKGHDGVWSKMHSFGPLRFFLRFKELQQGFKYGDEIVSYQPNKIYCYDQKTDRFECIPGAEAYTMRSYLSDCFTYTPNLVFLGGMASVYSENQIIPFGRYRPAAVWLITILH